MTYCADIQNSAVKLCILAWKKIYDNVKKQIAEQHEIIPDL